MTPGPGIERRTAMEQYIGLDDREPVLHPTAGQPTSQCANIVAPRSRDHRSRDYAVRASANRRLPATVGNTFVSPLRTLFWVAVDVKSPVSKKGEIGAVSPVPTAR
jgi:hypothetical protein